MPNTCIKPTRNQSMDCYKMIASILVVFLHVNFPEKFDGYVQCFAKFAIPVFFAISGYFNYGADQHSLTRRLKHLLRLYLIIIIANLIWGCFVTEYNSGSTIAFLRTYFPEPEEFATWLFLQMPPRSGHLWYLSAACVAYVILRAYVRFFGKKPIDYRPLYIISFCMFAFYFTFGAIGPIIGVDFPFQLYRNGYLWALPMFTLGIFIHEHQEQILNNYHLTPRKQVLLFFVGAVLGIFQWKTVGMNQITFGALLDIIILMTFLASHPRITSHPGVGETLISKFGAWSTWIYLLHIIMREFYQIFCHQPLAIALPAWEPWLRPIAVAGLSFLVAVLFEQGERLFNQFRKQKIRSH